MVRFSMVQSSTAPCVVVIAGGLLGSKGLGAWPSTVMKKIVELSESKGSSETSEKYRVRVEVGATVLRLAKRAAGGKAETPGKRRDVTASALLTWIAAS